MKLFLPLFGLIYLFLGHISVSLAFSPSSLSLAGHSRVSQFSSFKGKWNRVNILLNTVSEENIEPSEPDQDSNNFNIPIGSQESPQGYLSSDINSLGDGKQFRVFLYIALALVPCLFLVPFFMSRDFVPPADPMAYSP